MRALFSLSVLIALALSGRAAGSDLARIDRSLRKEPAYQSKAPQYALLVFGPQAKVRVWVVLDGDALYLDRNGNGDLTDPGECLAARFVHRRIEERPEVEVMRNFELTGWKVDGEEPILTCGPKVQWFYLFQLIPREDQLDVGNARLWHERPIDLAVTTKTGRAQRSRLRFGDSPLAAPVLHFDGPVQVAIDDKFAPFALRRGEPSELYARLVTPGLNATVTTDHDDFPEDAHPVVEVEWPPARAGAEPTRTRVELTQRC
jgi:hypothetical protein